MGKHPCLRQIQRLGERFRIFDKRIYFLNKLIKEVDYDTFEVVVLTSPEGYKLPYGKDKNQYYNYGNPLSEEEALEEVNSPL